MNADAIHAWAKEQGFASALPAGNLHVTLVYSKDPVDWGAFEPAKDTLRVKDANCCVKQFDGGAVVLAFDCDDLKTRHHEFREGGCTSNYPDYAPHVTITYEGAPADLSKVQPYRGEIVLGPEKHVEVDSEWKASRTETPLQESMSLSQIGPDQAYEIFRKSYEKETGKSWDVDKFMSRARNWTFYGDEGGYVAVRRQNSGLVKLTGVAGDPRSITKGINELMSEGGAIWGAVSEPLARMAVKRGMIAPHTKMGGPLFLKALMKLVPASVFGTSTPPEVTSSGAIRISYPDIGMQEKYLVGTKEYFTQVLRTPQAQEYIAKVPGLQTFLKMLGISMPIDENAPVRAFGRKGVAPGQTAYIRPDVRPPTDPEGRELFGFAKRHNSAEAFATAMNPVIRRNADPKHIHDAYDREHKKLADMWTRWYEGGLLGDPTSGQQSDTGGYQLWNKW
jgi:hypothetical protein